MPVDKQYGYKLDTQDDAIDTVKQYFIDEFGSDINLSDDSVTGAFANVLARALQFLDSLGLSLHDSMLLLKASGQSLDDITADEGIIRKTAVNSTVQLLITGYYDPDSPVIITPDEGEYSTPDGQVFRITDTVTINSPAQQANGQPLLDDDGNPLGQGVVQAVSEEPGASQNVAPNTIINAEQSVDGFYSVTNPTAAVGGIDVEDDTKLKERGYDNRLAKPNGTQDGLTTALKNIPDVKDARVIPNKTMTPDGYNNPPKSTHVYVLGGQADEIAQCLLDNGVLDTTWVGNSTGDAWDVSGKKYTINYDQAQQQLVYVKVNLKVDGNLFNSDYGVPQVQSAINSYFDTLSMGDDVDFTKLYAPIYSVAGVLGVEIALGTSQANVQPNTNVDVSEFEVPVVGNIDVEVGK